MVEGWRTQISAHLPGKADRPVQTAVLVHSVLARCGLPGVLNAGQDPLNLAQLDSKAIEALDPLDDVDPALDRNAKDLEKGADDGNKGSDPGDAFREELGRLGSCTENSGAVLS